MRLKSIGLRIIVSVLMVISLCLPAYATPNEDATTKYDDPILSMINDMNKPVDLYSDDDLPEIPELRQANSKAYRLNDSEIKFEVFPGDIHYLDENGSYQDIDNSIVDVKKGAEPSFKNRSNFKYKNNKNSWTAYFGDKEIYLDDGKYPISFEIQNISSESKLIRSNENLEMSDYDQKTAQDSRTVIYKNAFFDIDISYTSTEKELKEDIILRSYTGINKFVYKVDSAELTPVLKDERIIFINKTGEEVSSLGKLFMFDAGGNYSEELQYSLDNIDGRYYITVTADTEFLQSSSTVYPVVIDPTYQFQWQVSNGVTYDTFVSQKYPNSNYGSSQFLAASGSSAYTYGYTRTYIRFSNVDSVVPYDFPVSSATLWLRKKSSGGTGFFQPRVYGSESSWYETSLCYNNDNVARTPMDANVNYVESQYAVMFDISEIAQRWNHTGYEKNWGFEINNANSNHWIEFYSCEYSPKTDGPKLEIVAEDTSGYANKSLAYHKANCSATYYDALCNSTYTSNLSNAMSSWNRTNPRSGTGMNITRTTNVNNNWKVQVNNNIGSNTYGMNTSTYYPSTGETIGSLIEIHVTHSNMNNGTAYRNGLFRQHVFAHELGHTFGLADRDNGFWDPIIPGNNKWSLMSYAGNHHVVVVPSRRDINNVIANYN